MAVIDKIRQTIINKRSTTGAARCRRRFLRFFPRGFADSKYFDWERGYKLNAHEQWQNVLNRKSFRKLLREKKYLEIAAAATRIESRTNLLFSFEKMAFRDAIRETSGAKIFATALYELLYGGIDVAAAFERWCDAIGCLPRKQTRVLTHPVATVFPFIAEPSRHIFLKPNVTKRAAAEYGFEFEYNSKPSWKVYSQLLKFAETIKADNADLNPQDMIDIQSFIWAIGSDEYRSMIP